MRRRVFNHSRRRSRKSGCRRKHPRFIERNQGRRAVEALLDPAKQVEENRDNALFVELHQVLCFEGQEPAIAEEILVGVQQLPQRSGERVVLQSLPHLKILHASAQFRERAGGRESKLHDGVSERVPVFWGDGHALQNAESFQPTDGPGKIRIGVDFLQGAEREVGLLAGDVVELASGRLRQHIQRVTFVEREHLRAGIAEPLRRDHAKER